MKTVKREQARGLREQGASVRRNRLPYGTCRVGVHDMQLVQHIYGAIQEYAGFDREEWLM